MIPAGTANSLYQWVKIEADEEEARTAVVKTEWEALVARQINGGKPTGTLTSGSINGKTVTLLPEMSASDRLVVFTDVLTRLGVITEAPVTLTYGNFSQIVR
jgi:hypothetical protein